MKYLTQQNPNFWQSRITDLVKIYNKYDVILILGQSVVKNIPSLMSKMVSDTAAQTWLEIWQDLTNHDKSMEIPLRLLKTAVRYRETQGDRRVLLSLPIEERTLLEPLLQGDQSKILLGKIQ